MANQQQEEDNKNIQNFYDEVKLKKTQIIESSVNSLKAQYYENLWNLIEEIPKLKNEDLFVKHRNFIKQTLKRVSYDGFAIVFKKYKLNILADKGSTYALQIDKKKKSAIVKYYESTGAVEIQNEITVENEQFILLQNDISNLKKPFADIDLYNTEDYAHIEIISNIDYSMYVNAVRSKGTMNIPHDPNMGMSADKIKMAIEDGMLFYKVDRDATTDTPFGKTIDAKSPIKSEQLMAANFSNADASLKLSQTREERIQKLFKQKGVPPASNKEGTFNAHNSEILLGWIKENRELFSKLKHIKLNIEEILSYLENKTIKFDFDIEKYKKETIDMLSINENNNNNLESNKQEKNNEKSFSNS